MLIALISSMLISVQGRTAFAILQTDLRILGFVAISER